MGDRGGAGFLVVDGDVVESFGQVGGEPEEGGVSDAYGLKTAEEDGVIYCVKGSTEVEEEENGEGAGVRGEEDVVGDF